MLKSWIALFAAFACAVPAMAGQRSNDSISTIGVGARFILASRIVLPANSTSVTFVTDKFEKNSCAFEYEAKNYTRSMLWGRVLKVSEAQTDTRDNTDVVVYSFNKTKAVKLVCTETNIRTLKKLLRPQIVLNLDDPKRVDD